MDTIAKVKSLRGQYAILVNRQQ